MNSTHLLTQNPNVSQSRNSGEAKFQALLRDWQAATGAHHRKQQQNQEAVAEVWKTRFAAMKDEMDAMWAAGQWFSGPDNLLAIIGRQRHETYHSAILAWLLDPGAPHGLFTSFLVAMFRRLWPETPVDAVELRGATTCTELAKEHCRADIVVWAAGLMNVIEVKIDAGERGDQCNDYYRIFSKDSHNVRFAFLTPGGRVPDSATEDDAAKAFRRWSFRHIREDLAAILKSPAMQTSTAHGLSAVRTYLQTLEVEFP